MQGKISFAGKIIMILFILTVIGLGINLNKCSDDPVNTAMGDTSDKTSPTPGGSGNITATGVSSTSLTLN